MSQGADNKWWEFYGVRYAQGMVVGAMLVYFLFSQNSELKSMLFIPEKAEDFGVAHLALLAIYGLTYCYIASAPILVLHAARGTLFKSATNPTPTRGAWLRVTALGAPVAALGCFQYFTSGRFSVLEFGGIVIALLILMLQLIAAVDMFKFRWVETIGYMRAVIKKRELPENTGYVETYRHLREHGNAFAIVFLEFALATPLYIFVSHPSVEARSGVINLTILVFVWILPAMTVWIFGNKMENELQTM